MGLELGVGLGVGLELGVGVGLELGFGLGLGLDWMILRARYRAYQNGCRQRHLTCDSTQNFEPTFGGQPIDIYIAKVRLKFEGES